VYELSTAEQSFQLERENTLYAPADIELKETVRVLLNEVERVSPARVVFDSLSEISLLSQTPMRYRRQLLGLKQYFAGRECTTLLLDDRSSTSSDTQVESLVHGVVHLEQSSLEYGADRRRLRVVKLRGASFRSGYHDFVVRRGGLEVYPRLVAAEHRSDIQATVMSSGSSELDQLLGGGLERSTATLLMGPAGSGKSNVAIQFACAAASRGEHVAVFLFDERAWTMRRRARSMNLGLDEHEERGTIEIHQIDPAERAPDEFTFAVRDAVEGRGAKIVVIDSINGYFNAMPESRFLLLQMHELLSYLADRGVATIMTMAQSGVAGAMRNPVDVSYLSDSILLFRYFEAGGRVRKAISVIKKRASAHEDTIRELFIGSEGIRLGAPLLEFRGILTGVPEIVGASSGDTP
jgi:circadian clock protein KaiC